MNNIGSGYNKNIKTYLILNIVILILKYETLKIKML